MELNIIQYIMNHFHSFKTVSATLPAVFPNKLSSMLDNADLKTVDDYNPIIQMADLSLLSCSQDLYINPIRCTH